MNFDIKIYHSLNKSLEEAWKSFENDSENYCFQSYDWLESWIKNYRDHLSSFVQRKSGDDKKLQLFNSL